MNNTPEDVVKEAREFIGVVGNCGIYPDHAKRHIAALCDEVDRLRERWNTRFNTLCGNCGKRYLGPRDEHLHGYEICNVPKKD